MQKTDEDFDLTYGMAFGFRRLVKGTNDMDAAMFSQGLIAGIRFAIEHPEYAAPWHRAWTKKLRAEDIDIVVVDDGLSKWAASLVEEFPIAYQS